MKKFLAFVLLLAFFATPAVAESIDLSGLSFDELVSLRDRINLALWESSDWQEATVPQGVWEIGKDIPAGHWTIRPVDGYGTSISYGDVLNESQQISRDGNVKITAVLVSPSYSFFNENENKTEIDIDMKTGYFLIVDSGSAVLTPYAGKQALDFK